LRQLPSSDAPPPKKVTCIVRYSLHSRFHFMKTGFLFLSRISPCALFQKCGSRESSSEIYLVALDPWSWIVFWSVARIS
jgi:hypothetical protein